MLDHRVLADDVPTQAGRVIRDCLCRVVPARDDPVGAVHEQDPRGEPAGVRVGHDRVRQDDHQIAGVDEPGRGAVDPDDATAAWAGDRVRLQAGTVVDVNDCDLLAGQQVCILQQIDVDRHRADIVQIGLGDSSSMDLRLEHGPEHGQPASSGSVSSMLSISRTVPTRPATSSSAWPLRTGVKSSGLARVR